MLTPRTDSLVALVLFYLMRLLFYFFFFYSSVDHRDLHSFPTRRSSDLIRPALATLSIISFIGSWNSFLWPLMVLRSDTMYTIVSLRRDRKSTRLNSSHEWISYAVFCLKKKKKKYKMWWRMTIECSRLELILLLLLFSSISCVYFFIFFFFTHPSTTEIYTLSLHDALPI